MEKKLKENEVEIDNKVFLIKPIKIKYMKNGFYSNYMTIKSIGVAKLFTFTDAEDVLKGLLKAVLDVEEIKDNIYDNLDISIINNILEITKRLNQIEDEEEIKNDQTVEMKKV